MSINRRCNFKGALIIFLFIGNMTLYSQLNPVSDLTTRTSTVSKESKKSKDTIKDVKKGSFLPVPFFVTDQNIGFGMILALAYMHPNKIESRKNTPPSITTVFGGVTSKKTWTIGGAHTHSWNNDKLRYAGPIPHINAPFGWAGVRYKNTSRSPKPVFLPPDPSGMEVTGKIV